MAKKILIIGGFGFMGKNLNIFFKNHSSDYQVMNISRQNGYDITKKDVLGDVIKSYDPDIIIFAGANVGSMEYVSKYAADVVIDNLEMYTSLYKEILKTKKDVLIINPISNCSYPGIIDLQSEELWWEGKIHDSVLSYGMPKKMGYVISECYKKQHGINTLNLIMPNSYGENDYLEEQRTHAMNGIIMRMIKAQKNKDKEFQIWGTGTPIREWLYMPDIARLIKHILDKNLIDLPSPINIGQEYGVSILDTVKMVKNILNYDVELKFDLNKQDGAPKKVLSSKLFRTHFPDFVFTEYKEGIKNTIDYYNRLI